MGMHKLFDVDNQSSDTPDDNSFEAAEGLQTLLETSAMVRDSAASYAQGVGSPSHSGEAEVLKASCQAAVAQYTPMNRWFAEQIWGAENLRPVTNKEQN